MGREASSPGLWQLIHEDWEAHGRDWTKPGFRAIAIHRFGVWRMKLHPKLVRAPFSLVYRWCYRRARNHYGIDLPYSVQLGRRVVIEHCGAIVIHGDVRIGDDCIIRQGVTIGISLHGSSLRRTGIGLAGRHRSGRDRGQDPHRRSRQHWSECRRPTRSAVGRDRRRSPSACRSMTAPVS